MHSSNYSIGPIRAAGAVTVDFAIPANLPPAQVVVAPVTSFNVIFPILVCMGMEKLAEPPN
jgi:hypothetical protein